MAMDWSAVTESHVRQACDLVATHESAHARSTGLVVYVGEQPLPVKEVLRHAYRLAKGLGSDEEVKFASGEASLNLLRRLGFRVDRLGSRDPSSPQP